MIPIVLNSKPAQDDFDKIKVHHGELLQGMAAQSVRVAQANMQKATEMQAQQSMRSEMDQAKMAADTTAQKNANDFALKQSELDIKRAALTAA